MYETSTVYTFSTLKPDPMDLDKLQLEAVPGPGVKVNREGYFIGAVVPTEQGCQMSELSDKKLKSCPNEKSNSDTNLEIY